MPIKPLQNTQELVATGNGHVGDAKLSEAKVRSNRERTDATRSALLAAATELFTEKGYAATGTPEVVARAQLTRGALYHHFADKQALFFAVCLQAANEVVQAIDEASKPATTALEALILGAQGYFLAMAQEKTGLTGNTTHGGRARLLLIESISVLSPEQRAQINAMSGQEQLEMGLLEAMQEAGGRGDITPPIKELAALVSAAFDQAALAIARGESAQRYQSAIVWMLTQTTQARTSRAQSGL